MSMAVANPRADPPVESGTAGSPYRRASTIESQSPETTMARTRIMLGTALLAAALGSLRLDAQSVERRSLPGDDVAIYNLVGKIRVEAGNGSDVVAEVTRLGDDAAKLSIETGKVRGRESLRVIYPERRILFKDDRHNWSSRTQISVDDDGTFGDQSGDWRGDRYEITGTGRGMDARAEVRVLVPRGKRVAIYLGAGEATVNNVDGDIHVDVSAADVTTTNTRGSLNLDTGSGEVSVTDARGEITLDSGSGSVRMTRVNATTLRLDSGSGSVRGATIEADDLSVDSGSGSITLRGVKAPDINLDSGSGSVELELLADVESMKIDAGSGSITIGVPESLGAELSIETGSGGIDIDIPMTVTRKSRDYLIGRLGDGRGRMAIESGSGGVRIRRS
jgi:lia operon protein LiaG